MNQFVIERSVIYCNDRIVLNMENNGSVSQAPGGQSSKAKRSKVDNEEELAKGSGQEEIRLGYPVDEAEFRELKNKSKMKMDTDIEDDACQTDVSKEDDN